MKVVEDDSSPPSQPRHTILAPRLTTTRPAILQDKEVPEPEPIQITDKLNVQDRQIIQLTEKPARKRGSGAAQVSVLSIPFFFSVLSIPIP